MYLLTDLCRPICFYYANIVYRKNFSYRSFKFNRHNADMEKELMKMHRETRSSSKGEREKNSNETRKKKKEHLARCNASYHPTSAGATNTEHQVITSTILASNCSQDLLSPVRRQM